MKRLLYFIDNQITIIHRDKRHIELVNSYENNQEGLEEFEQYLEKMVKLPIQLLLDVVDEDFFHESIPHVSAKDRKAIVKRKAERVLHKQHEYYFYQLQGRDKEGRRNDNILLSGLTNHTFLQTILYILHKHEIPIVGIWSLPIISLKLIKLLQLKQDYLLIVSRQSEDNLRLTFINKKRFFMSRMVTLHGHDIFELIVSEINQTIKYLTNKRFVGFNDVISVCVIVREKNLALFKDNLNDNHNIKYLFNSHSAIEDLLKIKVSNESYNMAIYSELCFHEKSYQDHYSGIKEKKNYLTYLSKKTLLAFSFIFLIFSIVLSQFFLAQGEIARNNAINIQETESLIIQRYNKELLPLEEQ